MKNLIYCGTSEASKMLGVSIGTVQSMVNQNMLHAWKTTGGHRRISIESINEFKVRNKQQSLEPSNEVVSVSKLESLKLKDVVHSTTALSLFWLLLSLNARNYGVIFSKIEAEKVTESTREISLEDINLLESLGILSVSRNEFCYVCFVNQFSDVSYDWVRPINGQLVNIEVTIK